MRRPVYPPVEHRGVVEKEEVRIHNAGLLSPCFLSRVVEEREKKQDKKNAGTADS